MATKVRKARELLSPEHLAVLAEFAQTKYWETLNYLFENRIIRDKNSILTYPEYDPVRLATKKAFYRGRISALYLIRREVNGASKKLEEIEEENSKKGRKKK